MAVSDAAMLAPEEIFSGTGKIKDESELTQEERKRRRAKKKRKFKGKGSKCLRGIFSFSKNNAQNAYNVKVNCFLPLLLFDFVEQLNLQNNLLRRRVILLLVQRCLEPVFFLARTLHKKYFQNI